MYWRDQATYWCHKIIHFKLGISRLSTTTSQPMNLVAYE